MKNYIKTGRLVATHGLKGEIILKHSLGKKTMLKSLEAFFIEEKPDEFIPYFIESTRIKNDDQTYIKLEAIDDKESANKLIKNDVWLLESDFKKFVSASAPISFLGFTIFNDDKELGEILEVIEQPHQVLCRLLLNGKEAYIPVHEGSLEKIDTKKRRIFLILPDGLLDIYASA